jgi:hypothetical protein
MNGSGIQTERGFCVNGRVLEGYASTIENRYCYTNIC